MHPLHKHQQPLHRQAAQASNAAWVAYCFLLLAMLLLMGCNGDDNESTSDGDSVDGDSREQEIEPPMSDGDLDSNPETPVDGDAEMADWNYPPGDWDGEPFSCSGTCQAQDPTVCFDLELCVCEEGQFVLRNCDSICAERNGGLATGCSYDPDTGMDDCLCNPAWKPCQADGWITELPFSVSDDTFEAGDDFRVQTSCFDWGVMGEDHVYAIDMRSGDSLRAELTPLSEEYDPALLIASECSNLAVCLEGSDRNWAGKTETLSFTATERGRYFLVVDAGYQTNTERSHGAYELNVTGELQPPDGDLDQSEAEAEAEAEAEEAENPWPPDGDVMLDGDLDSDGDVIVDGDLVLDGDLVVDGDFIPDGDSELDFDRDFNDIDQEQRDAEASYPADEDSIPYPDGDGLSQ